MTAPHATPHGFYLDGQTPVQYPAKIELADDAIRFQLSPSVNTTLWEFATIDWDATRLLHGQLRIKHAAPDDAWLVITDDAVIAAVMAEKKSWARRHFWTARRELLTIIRATAATALITVALWVFWPYLTRPLTGLVPESTRNWMSDTAQSVLNLKQECRAPDGLAALRKITGALTAGNPQLGHANVIVVEADLLNALTLANDKILVTHALLAKMSSPEELSGIIAHELGHVAHRHILRNVLSNFTLKLLVLIFTGAHGEALGYASDLTTLAYTRQFETEADATAIDLLRRVHISTHGLGNFLRRLQDEKARHGSEPSRYFSSHPPSEERAQQMLNIEIPDAQPALTTDEWRALQNICGATPPTASQPEDDAPEPEAEFPPEASPDDRDI